MTFCLLAVLTLPTPTNGFSDEKPSVAGKTWGEKAKGFHLVGQDGSLDIHLDGRKVATYFFRHAEVKRPFFAHVTTRGGTQVTRAFPPVKGKDPVDHADMHPGIWLGFANLDGVTFWHNKEGEVVHDGFEGDITAGESATFVALNRYVAPGGKVICKQRTAYRLVRDEAGWLLAIDATFSSDKPFAFGVKEEMGLGIRVATPIAVKGGSGSIASAGGGRDEKGTWGKVDSWWDYSGTIDRRRVGLMVMSAAGNPDVWAHSRDYGVLVANPFPVDNKENQGKKTVVEPEKPLRLRFGVLVHDCAADEAFDAKAAAKRYANLAK
jgi:hypothetical protein